MKVEPISEEAQANNVATFKTYCKTLIHRDGFEDLMKWLDGTDFYTAPASTRFHGSYKGGLLQHSINVYHQFQRLLAVYQEIKCSEETAAIISLFHDITKVNFYGVEQRNRKNDDGKWERYDAYTIDEKYCFGGHGAKSVYLVQYFMRLTPEEAAAINAHMGAFADERVGNVYEQFPVAWLLHVADEAASYIDHT